MKNKNPLYVVKGKTVHEVEGIVDFFLKKFNLAPAFEVLTKVIHFLLSQVKDYPAFLMVKKFVDEVVEALMKVTSKFQKA